MEIVILGGGISGLSLAWWLKKLNSSFQITLLEKGARLGGVIETKSWNGALFEWGPRTFAYARSKHLLELMKDLEMEKEIVFSDPGAKKRYLWHKKKLKSVGSILPSCFLGLLREPFVKKGEGDDESIYDFALRRFNKKVAELLFDPMTLGIYGGDTKELSIKSCFPAFTRWEEEKGSVLKGFFARKKSGENRLFTLKRGMASLIERLEEKLAIKIVKNANVEKIGKNSVTASGKLYTADTIFSALPGNVLGNLTGAWKNFSAHSLWRINFALEAPPSKKGYGYLVPSKENEPFLGMIFDSHIFPELSKNFFKATAMLPGALSEKEALSAFKRAVKNHLKIEKKPLFFEAALAKGAIPLFKVGYQARLLQFEKDLQESFPNLLFTGNYVLGASVDACIESARKKAHQYIKYFSTN